MLIRMLADSLAPLLSLRQQARDLLFTAGHWWEAQQASTLETEIVLPKETAGTSSAESGPVIVVESGNAREAPTPDLRGARSPVDWAWVAVLSALALVVLHAGTSTGSRKSLRVGLPAKP
jgi:hypothetical protein